jgi:hypothetical protein
MGRILNHFIARHRFFVAETPSYMAGCEYSRFDYLRAYVRFMWFSRNDHRTPQDQ